MNNSLAKIHTHLNHTQSSSDVTIDNRIYPLATLMKLQKNGYEIEITV